MGDKSPGPICATQVGTNWIDGGTLCLSRSSPTGPTGSSQLSFFMEDETTSPEMPHGGYLWEAQKGTWVFSEFPPITIENKKPSPRVEITISVDEKNLAVGTARYTNAIHLNKYIAIHPGGPGNSGTPIIHSNIEIHIQVDGKEVPMTQRRVRYWDVDLAKGGTVANGGKWKINRVKGAKSLWDRPGAKDAPGMNFIVRPSKTTGDMHEFVAGTPEYGGAYYQIVTIYDPDGTGRVMVYNLHTLTAKEFSGTLKRVDRGADLHSFLFEGELTEDHKYSDSGILTNISDQ